MSDLAKRFPHTFKPKVWHPDGPVGQVRAMANWTRLEASGTPNKEMLGKIERNLREAADALEGQLSELEGLREALQAAQVPRAILFRVLGRHARLAILHNRNAPSVLIEREEDLLDEALNALQEVGRDRGWQV